MQMTPDNAAGVVLLLPVLLVLRLATAAAQCEAPASLAAGLSSTCPAAGAKGTTCTFKCADGYWPFGAALSECQDPGPAYAGQTLECIASTCAFPTGGYVISNCPSAGALGASCTVRCADGYTPDATSASTTTTTCTGDAGKPTASYEGHVLKCVSGESCGVCVCACCARALCWGWG